MKISAVIPVFNGERYLAEAIASVLAQTLAAEEILVVDDGSTDASAGVASSFGDRVRVLREPHAGAGAARNAGVRAVRGDAIAFLDADDLWEPDKLARQVAYLENNPSVDLVFAYVRNFHSPDLTEAQCRLIACPPDPMPGVTPSGLMVRAAACARIGPFAEELAAGELIGWMARVEELHLGVATLDDVLVRRRLHAGHLARSVAERNSAYLAAVKEMLDRRRGKQS